MTPATAHGRLEARRAGQGPPTARGRGGSERGWRSCGSTGGTRGVDGLPRYRATRKVRDRRERTHRRGDAGGGDGCCSYQAGTPRSAGRPGRVALRVGVDRTSPAARVGHRPLLADAGKCPRRTTCAWTSMSPATHSSRPADTVTRLPSGSNRRFARWPNSLGWRGGLRGGRREGTGAGPHRPPDTAVVGGLRADGEEIVGRRTGKSC
jgi:hypothetical protein